MLLWIRKLIAPPEECDGNIWGNPDNSKLREGDSLSPSNPPEYEPRPTIKAEQPEGPRGGAPQYIVQVTHWDLLQLAIYRKALTESQVKLKQSICGKPA